MQGRKQGGQAGARAPPAILAPAILFFSCILNRRKCYIFYFKKVALLN